MPKVANDIMTSTSWDFGQAPQKAHKTMTTRLTTVNKKIQVMSLVALLTQLTILASGGSKVTLRHIIAHYTLSIIHCTMPHYIPVQVGVGHMGNQRSNLFSAQGQLTFLSSMLAIYPCNAFKMYL